MIDDRPPVDSPEGIPQRASWASFSKGVTLIVGRKPPELNASPMIAVTALACSGKVTMRVVDGHRPDPLLGTPPDGPVDDDPRLGPEHVV